jgi:hypothetical protein
MKGNSIPNIDVNAVNIVLNNELTQLKNNPFINDGIVYLPLREILKLKGVTDESIIWDNGTIKIRTPQLTATLQINSDEIKKNNQRLDVGAKVLLQGAAYPAIKANDEYSIIIPKVVKDTDVVFEVIKNFFELVNQ